MLRGLPKNRQGSKPDRIIVSHDGAIREKGGLVGLQSYRNKADFLTRSGYSADQVELAGAEGEQEPGGS